MRLLCIPYNAASLSKRVGQESGSQAILDSLPGIYLSESGLPKSFEVSAVSLDNGNLDEANKKIHQAVLELKDPAILLGGDHGLTYSAFSAHAKRNSGAGLVVFDAHPDCENDMNPPTHEDYLRMLIEQGHVDPGRVILVGIRNSSIAEHNYLRSKRIKIYTMQEIMHEGLAETCDAIMAAARQWPTFYLSIDIDVVDPAFAPGTGYREPGGLSSREMIYFAQRLRLLKNLSMTDIVEVNPTLDRDQLTVKLAAKLVWELS